MNKTVCGSCGAVEVSQIDEKGMDPLPGKAPGQWFEPDGAGLIAKRKRGKKRRLRTLGAWDAKIPEGKSFEDADVEVEAFICGMDRKVYESAEGPCAACPGGCSEEKGLPSLVEVEGMAEEDFGTKILGSGFGSQADLFIVQMEHKDGLRVIEAHYSGSTGELLGFITLDDSMLTEKAYEEGVEIMSADQAADIALKGFGGEVLTVGADQFEGQDAWVVEMENDKGDSLDVFVGLDGTTLGYDLYEKAVPSDEEEEDAEEVDAEDDTEEPVADEEEGGEDDDEEEAEEKSEVQDDIEIKALLDELNEIAASV